MGVYIPRLPNAYQEVEYIDWPGSSNGLSWPYIDTGYKANNNTRFLIDYQPLWVWAWPIGSYNNPSWVWFIINCIGNSYEILPHYNTSDSWTGYAYNTRVTADLNKNNFYINWELKKTFTAATFQMNINTWLFWWNRNGVQSNCRSMRLYNAKIYDNWTLVRDFIPCYRKSDNEIWVYDLVNNQFYTKSWTGTFSKWANVTAVPLKNAYIGKVIQRYTPTANTVVYYPFVKDFNDYSWNWHDLTISGSPLIWNVWGVTCFKKNWTESGEAVISSLPQWSSNRTNMMWVNWNSTTSGSVYWYGQNTNYKWDMLWKNNPISWGSYWYNADTNITATLGRWYFLAVTTSSSPKKQLVYVNGVQSWSSSYTINTTGTTLKIAGWTGVEWVSEFIIENRAWTAQEIKDFYNATCEEYWLQPIS